MSMRKAVRAKAPAMSFEREFWADGIDRVAGVDEVGRGSWAGPLTVGAVVPPTDRRLYKLRDSKMLRPAEREEMFERIAEWAAAWAVGHASPAECDALGMSAAQKLAARRAIDGLGDVGAVLVDGNWDFVGHPHTRTLVKGDQRSASIAAASIMAKVSRDRLMIADSANYPGFDFDRNKGYPCPRHRTAITAYGPTAIHRRAWAFMDGLPWRGCERVTPGGHQERLFG